MSTQREPPVLTMDLHLHSEHSCDSDTPLADMARAALERGYRIVAFTEHVDHNPRDSGYGYYDYDRYRDAVERARETFGDRIELLMGIEFDSPHRYPDALEQEQRRPYDFIMGSLHFSGRWFFGEPELLQENERDDVFRRYTEDLCIMLDHGGFDVMGHIGFPQRYLGAEWMPDHEMRNLCGLLSETGIVPEINTSGFRKGLDRCMPDGDFLSIYREMTGGLVTVGSDAHRPEDIGAGLEHAARLVRQQRLRPVVFRRRRAERPEGGTPDA